MTTPTARHRREAKNPLRALKVASPLAYLILTTCSPAHPNSDPVGGVERSALTRTGDAHRADWDGDAFSDVSVYRPGNINGHDTTNTAVGQWFYVQSVDGASKGWGWGRATDVPLLGDFDADFKEDLTVWRPATGEWFTALSSQVANGLPYQGSIPAMQWGQRGDVPVQGDYDGDGKTDQAVWRPYDTATNSACATAPCIGYWLRRSSRSGGSLTPFQWGDVADIPVPADYDGDGTTDMAVWRPSTGQWIARLSATSTNGIYPPGGGSWGATTDVLLPGQDYDGDGKADLTVFRPQTGEWLILQSGSGYSTSFYVRYNTSSTDGTDIPVVADFPSPAYSSSISWWHPSTGIWTGLDFWNLNQNDILQPANRQWGVPTDMPVNGVRRFPFVTAANARVNNGANYETTALTVPPNKAACGASGAAFLSGSLVTRTKLSCWQNGPGNPAGTVCTSQCKVDADCGGGQKCLVATGVDKTNVCTLDLTTLDPSSPGVYEDRLSETSDNNIVRMNNGQLLIEHLGVRYEPSFASNDPNNGCSAGGNPNSNPKHRQGIAEFFTTSNCGNSWTKSSSITKSSFGNDWKKMQFDGSRALYNNPYSVNPDGTHGRVYFSVENDGNCAPNPWTSELFFSTDYAKTWVHYTAAPQLPFVGGSYTMTAAPSHREYIFGCPNNVPSLYVFAESTNQIMKIWTDTANACDHMFLDGSSSVSFISSEEDGDFVRVVYPQLTTTAFGQQTQYLHLSVLNIKGPDAAMVISKRSDNTLHASAGGQSSIVLATVIEPDMLELPGGRQPNAALLYWVESDGLLVNCGSNCGKASNAFVKVTNKGVLLRDLNLWSPVFPIVPNDASGNPLTWTGWSNGGDYRRGGFVYDAANDLLNFYPEWVGADNGSWNTNRITAHP